ncbi:response regulator receiver sensor signal transduction histidine kinase [Chthoniobacter flavus Ellin428]|uniref:histidine kinase n=1 Tax=Chthoniobacter flavus Ellin428 TaxID=497964 RepID=B4CVF4_9BACT|nr:hybrid sensor histidine kinase/response regulator [Chthoniobacter flavus]EDY21396.1 response regulator receiver sensor signal transduction histidine kinase [Chthoniobacter flavus Ellin428]TCO95357.1 phospho-acceptor domain-containing protein [Chthoniobacter flavus]
MNEDSLPADAPDILVVDDTPANLQLLTGMLKERGYKVRPVPSGKLALLAAKNAPPDLILLDINMPELDGYEVCTQLKRDERTRDVPVLFISALNETMDKVLAFGVGGLDYITKPFQFEEVDARVAAHLKLRRLQLDLAVRNRELQRNNEELRRLQELRDNLTQMIVHDLRSPLTGIFGTYELLALEADKLSPEIQKMIELSQGSLDQILSMINSLLDVSKIEAGELQLHRCDCDLVALAREAADMLAGIGGKRRVLIEPESENLRLSIDRDLIFRVLQNLLGNALKFTKPAGEIRVRLERRNDRVRVSVIDNGPGISPEYHRRIFEKFGQVECATTRTGTGLGLTFCRLVIEAHGGAIGVVSAMGKGSTFWFELPDIQ